ncbi:beta-hexosaminidase beta chain precursor, putative [Entamoeba invadens IP1]|uniref:Beta-hexosaminidase n=1 Tax=Entamoeba invadens IP1 TaxID=370355 RepID=A0A0A1TXA8_ENTIV|nr:beta-hexosaminidase beta chain precursor, putative [Entamoeba invadens IP1]ELP85950.1 beta-hexosaminidase beta chain precursor, putative [Entamoeba invadens IP1]|eukprot:XP_004185296.1 beta-hexosaminidase beta chain precursor, putative [Entamoeba invadens IP1]
MFLLFATLLSVALSGNGLNVQSQMLLMPYPKSLAFNYLGTTSLIATSTVKMSLSSNCQNDINCLAFMQSNFNHTITYPLQVQSGIKDFRISLFSVIDIPHITPGSTTTLSTINIYLTAPIYFPTLKIGIDEDYQLSATSSGVTITASNAYGARHGLETLIQLFRPLESKSGSFAISQLPITISDSPRFKWRGLMLDCARNPLSKETFVKVINSLAAVKANVLHLHLTDGQTFVFESKEYPNLSAKGAYDQNKVLTQKFLQQLSEYGRSRGVIVYPEIDIPAHAASWNLGYPGVVADCWSTIKTWRYGENIPALNPTNDTTFKILEALFQRELPNVFGNDYVHIGGDEMVMTAWEDAVEYSDIQKWMSANGISTLLGLESYFNKYAQDKVMASGKTPVAWEEVYKKGNADKSTIVEVWSDISLLKKAVDDGYKAIWSAGFYLDMQRPLASQSEHHMWVWTNRDFYANDPTSSFTAAELENVLGGEGCSWHESVDDANVIERIFQRYNAIAERLWSAKSMTNAESLEVRADYVRCLGQRRGFMRSAGPLYASYCQLPEEK